MNLYPLPTESPMAPADWTMELTFEDVGATSQCTGTILLLGKSMCRLSVTAEAGDCDAVRMALAEKARAWIAEYLRRANEADT